MNILTVKCIYLYVSPACNTISPNIEYDEQVVYMSSFKQMLAHLAKISAVYKTTLFFMRIGKYWVLMGAVSGSDIRDRHQRRYASGRLS